MKNSQVFLKSKNLKVLQIFAFQKIASEIDAEALKCPSASKTDAIEADYWTHNKLTFTMNVNSGKDYNLKLWDKPLKDIYLETNISGKYSSTTPENNIKLIEKIYDEKNAEIIKFLDLSYGEVFEIFIKDINTMNLKLKKKIKDSEILDNSKFLTIKDFLNKIKEEEKKKGESDEFIDKYITDIKNLCLNFKQWFISKRGRKKNK